MADLEKLTYTIKEAMAATGLSRSEIYLRLSDQSIKGRKNRSRTLIDAESLRAFITGLPPATFRPPSTIIATAKAA
jgi:hypothetical protein